MIISIGPMAVFFSRAFEACFLEKLVDSSTGIGSNFLESSNFCGDVFFMFAIFRLLDKLLADERTIGLARVTAVQLSGWKNMSVVKTCLNTICFDSCSAAQLWRHCTHVTPLLNFARRSHPKFRLFR